MKFCEKAWISALQLVIKKGVEADASFNVAEFCVQFIHESFLSINSLASVVAIMEIFNILLIYFRSSDKTENQLPDWIDRIFMIQGYFLDHFEKKGNFDGGKKIWHRIQSCSFASEPLIFRAIEVWTGSVSIPSSLGNGLVYITVLLKFHSYLFNLRKSLGEIDSSRNSATDDEENRALVVRNKIQFYTDCIENLKSHLLNNFAKNILNSKTSATTEQILSFRPLFDSSSSSYSPSKSRIENRLQTLSTPFLADITSFWKSTLEPTCIRLLKKSPETVSLMVSLVCDMVPWSCDLSTLVKEAGENASLRMLQVHFIAYGNSRETEVI